MAEIKIVPDTQALADIASEFAAKELAEAISSSGQTSWALAGGSTPMSAYRLMIEKYKDNIDWEKIWLLVGDERCGIDDEDEVNWLSIDKLFISKLDVPLDQQLIPKFRQSPESAAADYGLQLRRLALEPEAAPRLGLLWLGVGDDGHTLSLFPGKQDLGSDKLVVAVHNSPKPPPDRISLTLKALTNVGACLIIVSGEAKASIVAQAIEGQADLPIVSVIKQIEAYGGKVTWLIDQAAARDLKQQ
jgi:6-phosphogluconolactonase